MESVDSVSADGKTLTRQVTLHPLKGAPVTGMLTYTRAAAPPVGAHAISGTWNVAKVASSSDALLTVTYRATRDGMSMTAGTGTVKYTGACGTLDLSGSLPFTVTAP